MMRGCGANTKRYHIERALDRLKGKGEFTIWDFIDTTGLDLTRNEAAGLLRGSLRVKYHPSPMNLREPGTWEVIA